MKDEQNDIQWLFSKLSEHTTIRHRLIPSYSGFERGLVWTGITAFCLAVVVAIFTHFLGFRSATVNLIGLSLVLLAELAGVGLVITAALEPIKSMLHPTKSLLIDRARWTQRDFDFARQLSAVPTDSLEFAITRLRSEAEHIRARVGLLVGALDKIGMVPLGASTILTLWTIQRESSQHGLPLLIPSYVLYSIAGGLFFLCVAGVGMFRASHRIEEITQIVQLALDQKNRSVVRSEIVEE
jgi:hypothetical protein